MAIESYDQLQDAVADWLLRSDLDSVIPDLIHNAESDLQRDDRIRNFIAQGFTVDSEEESLPSDFRALDSVYHDGDTYFGEINIKSLADLSLVNAREDGTAAPTDAAIIGNSTIRFAPEPDQEYSMRISYWQTIPHLSDSKQSNWLLDDSPDIYLYASLVESAPYLKDDERLALWRGELERRIERFHRDISTRQYSGSLVKQIRNPIP